MTCNTNHTDFSLPDITECKRGIQNKLSNCWLNSIFQCLSVTHLPDLLKKWSASAAAPSFFHTCITFFEEVGARTKSNSAIKITNGLLAIAETVGMPPNKAEHEDACEFFGKFLNHLSDHLPFEGQKELKLLFLWKNLELNRCLNSECNSMNGKTGVMWNHRIQIPSTTSSVRLQSLLWTQAFGRFTTEDDEVCKTCVDCKPAAHHVELFVSTPDILTFTVNRIIIDFNGKPKKIYTPIFCDRVINLRGISAAHYDDMDIECTLLAAVVHKGPSINCGHFVSYVFNAENTAIIYDDERVQVIDSNKLLTSDNFMKNVYMCFYAKGNRWCSPKIKREIQHKTERGHVRNDETTENVPWALSKSELRQVKQIWSFRKKVFFMRCTISSHQLLTLQPGHWLGGDVVNGFLQGLLTQYSNASCPSFHVFSSYLYTDIATKSKRQSIIRQAMAVDPMKHEMLFFPINHESHWILVVCFPVSSILVYFDSLMTINISVFGHVLGLMEALLTTHGHQFDREKLLLLAPDDIPRQQDACSCGVYVCMNAVTLIQSPHIPIYSCKDITKIRQWMVNFLVKTHNVTKPNSGRKRDDQIEIPLINYLAVRSSDIARKVPPCSLSTGTSVFQDIHALSSSRKLYPQISVDLDEPAEKRVNAKAAKDTLTPLALGEELLGNKNINLFLLHVHTI